MDTLVHDPFFAEIPEFFALSLEQFLELKHPTSWIDFELGRLSTEEYYARMFRDARPVPGRALEARVQGAYRYLEGVEPLLAELAGAGVEMHALSNYPVWYQLIDEALGLGRYVRWSFVSCRTGLRKPDEAAYENALEVLGLEGAECLFVDDREDNCTAARRGGIPSVRFTDAARLRQALVELGLLRG